MTVQARGFRIRSRGLGQPAAAGHLPVEVEVRVDGGGVLDVLGNAAHFNLGEGL